MAERYGYLPKREDIQIMGDIDALKKIYAKKKLLELSCACSVSFEEADPPVLFFSVGQSTARHHVYVQKKTNYINLFYFQEI